MKTALIRRKFLDYFIGKGHARIDSSPVIPQEDPSLLFANAGMNQFKDFFLGIKEPHYTQAASSQKCIRAGGKHNDLADVGYTSRHLTFFEMLGNFSFGSYFKQEAIHYAFEVSTSVLEIDKERIFATIFEEDDEAFDLWLALLPEKQIVRMGRETNFWAMGETGPCGPCSELLFDRGPHFGKATHPLEDHSGERFLEFWNLVFMQYERHEGIEIPLKKKSIDTGMGLERIASLKQGVSSVFEIDLFRSLIDSIQRVVNKPYSLHPTAFHVIADHIRSLSFALADGAIFSNVERGYVLRKILRRAFQFGRRLGQTEPFLHKLVLPLSELMGETYKELIEEQSRIEEQLFIEEEAFLRTLKRGAGLLQKTLEEAKESGILSGSLSFKMHDTYGFPLDELELIAKDHGITIDRKGYEEEEKIAKERSKQNKQQIEKLPEKPFLTLLEKEGPTHFFGYETLHFSSEVIAIWHNGAFVDHLEKGQEGALVLKATPFYPEKGGQIGDQGQIGNFEVRRCFHPVKGLILHQGIAKGPIQCFSEVEAKVDPLFRHSVCCNHSATHLLQLSLQKLLGTQVHQQGSLVADDRLRFDFNLNRALTQEELFFVEKEVTTLIFQNLPIQVYEISYEEAKSRPEIKQFFQEKYDSLVRVVQIGQHSWELCAGTHATSTYDLFLFKIIKEGSVASGIRRIEAVTGKKALDLLFEREALLQQIVAKTKIKESQLLSFLDAQKEKETELKKELSQLKQESQNLWIEQKSRAQEKIIKTPYSPKEFPQLAEALLKRGIDPVFLYQDRSFFLASLTHSCRALLDQIGPAIEAKGGGSERSVQGHFNPTLVAKLNGYFGSSA